MTRTFIISELLLFIALSLGIQMFSAHIWDDVPRGIIVLIVAFSLVLGFHTSEFLNRFNSQE